jgi:uncharacterized protein (DUF1501 family)
MPRLVNVFLRGGADGLSLLAPVGDPAYHAARPTQALGDTVVLDVGIDGFGLHPAAPRLAEMVRAGSAALVPAAGYGGQTRSHFESQAILETAVGDDGMVVAGAGVGWLGRLVDAGASKSPAPFRAVAVGSVSVPPSLWGTGDSLGVPDPAALRLGALRPARRRRGSYEVLDSPLAPDPSATLTAWGGTGVPPVAARGAATAVDVLDRLRHEPIEPGDPAAFGDSPASATFAAASALLDAGLGTEVVQVDLGGWDTHNAQGTSDGTFAELVAGLDAGLATLVQRHAGRDGGLVIAVTTEFGRRVQENASGGTDHGRGGLAIVLGDGVLGGLRGSWPGLADLDNGDVRAVNDLRVVQSEIADHIFGTATPTAKGASPLGLFGG